MATYGILHFYAVQRKGIGVVLGYNAYSPRNCATNDVTHAAFESRGGTVTDRVPG